MFHNRNKKQKTSDHQLANYKQIAMFPSYRILISNELEKLYMQAQVNEVKNKGLHAI